MAGLMNWQESGEPEPDANPEASGRPSATRSRSDAKAESLLDAAVDRLQSALEHNEQHGLAYGRGQPGPGAGSWSWSAGWFPQRGHAKVHEEQHGEVDRLMNVPAFSQWTTVGYITGWDEAGRRMSNEAATFGVLAALLASLTFPTFITPPNFSDRTETCLDIDPSMLEDIFGISVFMAVVFAVADVCTAATTIMQLGACSTEADQREFFLRFQSIAGANFMLFLLSILSLSIAGWSVLVYRYSLGVVIGCTVFMLVCQSAVLALAAKIFMGFTLTSLQAQHSKLLQRLQQRLAAASRKKHPPAAPAGAAGAGGQQQQQQQQSARAGVHLPKQHAQE